MMVIMHALIAWLHAKEHIANNHVAYIEINQYCLSMMQTRCHQATWTIKYCRKGIKDVIMATRGYPANKTLRQCNIRERIVALLPLTRIQLDTYACTVLF
jgi:hypothetical protein